MEAPQKHPGTFSAIVQCKCPRCREAEIFEYPAYRLDAFYKMYPLCPNCKQDLQVEPGFFMGASYIGYGFTVILTLLGAFLYAFVFPEANEWLVIASIVLVILMFIPLIFRYARVVMLYTLGSIKFDPSYQEQPKGMYVGEDGELHQGIPPLHKAEQ
jgi:uncharacterized protein (DUF983 family)